MITIARAEVLLSISAAKANHGLYAISIAIIIPDFILTGGKERKKDFVANCSESPLHQANCKVSSAHVSRTIPSISCKSLITPPPKHQRNLCLSYNPCPINARRSMDHFLSEENSTKGEKTERDARDNQVITSANCLRG